MSRAILRFRETIQFPVSLVAELWARDPVGFVGLERSTYTTISSLSLLAVSICCAMMKHFQNLLQNSIEDFLMRRQFCLSNQSENNDYE